MIILLVITPLITNNVVFDGFFHYYVTFRISMLNLLILWLTILFDLIYVDVIAFVSEMGNLDEYMKDNETKYRIGLTLCDTE